MIRLTSAFTLGIASLLLIYLGVFRPMDKERHVMLTLKVDSDRASWTLVSTAPNIELSHNVYLGHPLTAPTGMSVQDWAMDLRQSKEIDSDLFAWAVQRGVPIIPAEFWSSEKRKAPAVCTGYSTVLFIPRAELDIAGIAFFLITGCWAFHRKLPTLKEKGAPSSSSQ